MSKFKDGDKCTICDALWKPKLKYQGHHTDYKHDIESTLCYTCHALLHGSAKVWKHPFAKYGKDKAPYIFARRVVEMYEDNKPVSEEDKAKIREFNAETDRVYAELTESFRELEIVTYLDDINAKSPENNTEE